MKSRCRAAIAAATGMVAALMSAAGPAYGSQTDQFRTPSGNIVCATGTRGVVCQILEYSYAPPQRPDTCHGTYGDVFSQWDGRPAEIRCHTDRPFDPQQGEIIEYGKTVQAADVVCTVLPAYIECLDPYARHGFRLSRESYTVY
ncbi:DUF6636 domain-containing protein [Nocardia crassostreae]|uniref:DUF6636 domain-containing protein n=1 Tax=Nocardia crassostreae TaxID=53428 RepID=UPI000830AAC7|nr:DUF6636 domain-containing protein [Nocardia crassostreae]